MSTSIEIENFLSTKKFAFAGISRNPKSYSRQVMKSLTEKGYDIIPVNPNADEIDGKKSCKNLDELSTGIDRLLIMTNKKETDNILKAAISKGMKSVWIQQGSDTKDTILIAKANNFENLITKQCIFMFTEPKGLHKFHRTINKIFGLLPK